MRISTNYLLEILNQVFQVLVPLLTMPYVARVLGAELVGISSYTFSIVTIFGTFGLLGINVYGNRTIAAHRNNPVETNNNFWAIFFIKLLSVLLTTSVYFVFLSQSTYANKQYMLLQSLNLLAIALDVSWLFAGHEDFLRITIRNIIVRTISLIGVFALVKSGEDLYKYILLIPVANIIGNLLLWPQMFRDMIERPQLDYRILKKHLPAMLSVFASQIAIQMYVTMDKVIVGMISGDKFVGIYDYAQKIARLSMIVIGSLGTVIMPRMSNLWQNNKHSELQANLQMSVDFSAFIAFPILLGLIAVANSLTAVLFPPEFAAIATLLKILSPCIVFWSINNITSFQILLPTKNEKYLTISVLAGAVFNPVVNYFVVSRYGIQGAAIVSVFTELLVTAIQLYFAARILSLKLDVMSVFRSIVPALFMFVIISIIGILPLRSLNMLLLQLSIGAIVYVVLALMMRIEPALRMKELLNKKLWKLLS